MLVGVLDFVSVCMRFRVLAEVSDFVSAATSFRVLAEVSGLASSSWASVVASLATMALAQPILSDVVPELQSGWWQRTRRWGLEWPVVASECASLGCSLMQPDSLLDLTTSEQFERVSVSTWMF